MWCIFFFDFYCCHSMGDNQLQYWCSWMNVALITYTIPLSLHGINLCLYIITHSETLYPVYQHLKKHCTPQLLTTQNFYLRNSVCIKPKVGSNANLHSPPRKTKTLVFTNVHASQFSLLQFSYLAWLTLCKFGYVMIGRKFPKFFTLSPLWF
jgi:hypothetical protein